MEILLCRQGSTLLCCLRFSRGPRGRAFGCCNTSALNTPPRTPSAASSSLPSPDFPLHIESPASYRPPNPKTHSTLAAPSTSPASHQSQTHPETDESPDLPSPHSPALSTGSSPARYPDPFAQLPDAHDSATRCTR